MTTYDPTDGTPGIDDNAPGSPPDPDPAPGRRLAFAYAAMPCKHCRRAILLGPVCCPECVAKGFCSICGEYHRAWQCPDVARARREMAAAEMAAVRQIVRDHAQRLLAEYEANPIAA